MFLFSAKKNLVIVKGNEMEGDKTLLYVKQKEGGWGKSYHHLTLTLDGRADTTASSDRPFWKTNTYLLEQHGFNVIQEGL